MTLERIKIAFVVLFFLGLLLFTGSAQKDVLRQKDPQVLNFLAAAYCPNIVQPGDTKPLTVMDVVIKGAPDKYGRILPNQPDRADPNRPGSLAGSWEAMAADRHARGLPGYEKAWKVRFLEMPALAMGGGRDSWALTRLMSGEAPEFMWAQSTPEYADRCDKWYIDLSPYLNRPNPYVPGNQRWIDIFYPDSLSNWRATVDRHLYCIPIDQVEIAVFYNKRILARCGITEADLPPKNWAEFITLQRRIQQAGEIPFLMPAANNMRIGWMIDILNDMLWAARFDEFNAVNDPDLTTRDVDPQEVVRAFKKGFASLDDDRYWEVWRVLKDWSQYWQGGFLGSGDQVSFLQGKVAMTVDGSWFVKTLINDKVVSDPVRGFEWGTFFIPTVTKETSAFVADPPSPARGVGGSTAIQYSITKETALRKGAVEACVDLLMYITAPQNLGPMVAEGQSFLPTVRGAPLAENLKFMLPVLEAGAVRFRGLDNINARCVDERWAEMQYWLEGKHTREQAIGTMKAAVARAMDEQLEKYKDQWKWLPDAKGNRTWEIEPPVSKLRPEDRPTTQPSSGPFRPTTPEQAPTPGAPASRPEARP